MKTAIPPMYGWQQGGGTITLQINSTNDDGHFHYNTGGGGGDTDLGPSQDYQQVNHTSCRAYLDPATDDAYYKKKAFFRFVGVGIAQGTVIQSAYLKIVIDVSQGTGDMTIVALDTDNATNSPPSRLNSARDNHTTASVIWSNPTANGVNHVSSPDIKSVIQEIVNRSGWSSGNSILIQAVFLHQSGEHDRQITDYQSNSSRAAKLEITT